MPLWHCSVGHQAAAIWVPYDISDAPPRAETTTTLLAFCCRRLGIGNNATWIKPLARTCMAGKTSARPMTGGMAIVETLIANKVDRVFGLPGAQLYALFDALAQRSDVIATIGARHEQARGYMAFGYARSTGRPGVYV